MEKTMNVAKYLYDAYFERFGQQMDQINYHTPPKGGMRLSMHAKSLFNIVEMRSDLYRGNSDIVRITCH